MPREQYDDGKRLTNPESHKIPIAIRIRDEFRLTVAPLLKAELKKTELEKGQNPADFEKIRPEVTRILNDFFNTSIKPLLEGLSEEEQTILLADIRNDVIYYLVRYCYFCAASVIEIWLNILFQRNPVDYRVSTRASARREKPKKDLKAPKKDYPYDLGYDIRARALMPLAESLVAENFLVLSRGDAIEKYQEYLFSKILFDDKFRSNLSSLTKDFLYVIYIEPIINSIQSYWDALSKSIWFVLESNRSLFLGKPRTYHENREVVFQPLKRGEAEDIALRYARFVQIQLGTDFEVQITKRMLAIKRLR